MKKIKFFLGSLIFVFNYGCNEKKSVDSPIHSQKSIVKEIKVVTSYTETTYDENGNINSVVVYLLQPPNTIGTNSNGINNELLNEEYYYSIKNKIIYKNNQEDSRLNNQFDKQLNLTNCSYKNTFFGKSDPKKFNLIYDKKGVLIQFENSIFKYDMNGNLLSQFKKENGDTLYDMNYKYNHDGYLIEESNSGVRIGKGRKYKTIYKYRNNYSERLFIKIIQSPLMVGYENYDGAYYLATLNSKDSIDANKQLGYNVKEIFEPKIDSTIGYWESYDKEWKEAKKKPKPKIDFDENLPYTSSTLYYEFDEYKNVKRIYIKKPQVRTIRTFTFEYN